MTFTYILLIIVVAFIITYISIPSIIKVAYEKHLCDEPDEDRKIHTHKIPTLGGIAIFGGVMITSLFFVDITQIPNYSYAVAALLILFFTGVKDDIIPLTPTKKFSAQIFAACILTLKCNIYLSNLYGFFFVNDIPYFVGVILSIFTILVIVNAFNLVDGINGLSGGLGVIISLTFGILFLELNKTSWGYVAFSLAGALLGFLMYNYGNKAKIFMGDTGSLTVGLFLAMFAIVFIETNREVGYFKSTFAPVYAITILIIPLADTLRLFIWRILQKRSPFSADRNHFHHYLVDGGLTHFQGSLVLHTTNLGLIGLMLLFQEISQVYTILFLLLFVAFFTWLLWNFRNKNNQKKPISTQNTPIATTKTTKETKILYSE